MADVAPPTFKKRTQKSTNIRKRPATPPPDDNSDSDSYSSSDGENGTRIKRRKKDGVAVTATGPQRPADLSKSTKFSADRSTTISANDDATKTSNWSVLDSSARPTPAVSVATDETKEGVYKGTSTYGSFIQKNPNSASRQVGPVKAASNVRTITVTDFAPDVCKDYKQTGFCGFGDSCKFLHAREDYKQGWQLDKEWETVGKSTPWAKTNRNSASKGTEKDGAEDDGLDDEERLLEKIPFKCIICKDDYKNPVVTRCEHYFCERCAMGRYMKEKKKSCANCGGDTGGTFNVARKLKELLAKKRKRMEEKEGNGEDGKAAEEVVG